MCAYAYKTTVSYDRELIRENHVTNLEGDTLVISKLEKLVGLNPFTIDSTSEGYVIEWTTYRDETDAEMAYRITKGEAYNAEVDKRRAARGEKP